MSLTVEQLLTDARRLSTRLKDHDSNADSLITRSQEVLREVEAMRQYQENIENLNEVAHNRPRANLVLGIQQENSHIRSLQNENKELRAALEEHQSALELIMSKYREHITSMIKSGKRVDYNRDPSASIIKRQTEKICEMAGVMKGALRLDEEKEVETKQLIVRLATENKGLRELLGISAKNQSLPPTKKAAVGVDQAIQTEVRLEEEDEQCRSGIELEVTLPMPAPPPRLNRGSSTAAAAAGQTTQAKTSPAEDDTDGRLSVSPLCSASESDETGSDDDSIKFDTIKLSRRKTVLPATQSAAATTPLSTASAAADDGHTAAVDAVAAEAAAKTVVDQINNNPPPQPLTSQQPDQELVPTPPHVAAVSPTPPVKSEAAKAAQDNSSKGIDDADDGDKAVSPQPLTARPGTDKAASPQPLTARPGTDNDEPQSVAVTNCASIVHDILVDSMNAGNS